MSENACYRKEYRLRRPITGKDSVEVTFPFDVVDRMARQYGITVDDFLNSYMAIAEYNGFDGVKYTFRKYTDK
jgi:hypothetical protein